LSLEITWLQENKHKRSDKLTFYGPCHIISTKEGLPPRILSMQAMSPIQGRHTPTNQRATRGHHMDWRAHWHPNRLKIKWTPRTNLSTHRTYTWRKHTLSGVHMGSADPRSAEPTLWPPSWASTWCLLVGPSFHLGGVSNHSTPVLRAINRRGGDSFLTNTSYYSSLTFGFSG
jgi:hypothetical protein